MWFGRGGWGVRLVGVDGVVGLGGVVGVIRKPGVKGPKLAMLNMSHPKIMSLHSW